MEILKAAGRSDGAPEVTEEMLEKINRFTLQPLTAEQVFVFKIAACDDQIDRDLERFTPECLNALAPMFVGKPVIFDHRWSAEKQTARIFDSETQTDGGVTRLIVYAYLLRSASQEVTDAINAGILREVSVGCAVGMRTCSICGEEYWNCGHLRGETYSGKQCYVNLNEATDAYELSFVAVPAQRDAGVTKSADAKLAATDAEKKLSLLRKRLELKNKIIKI